MGKLNAFVIKFTKKPPVFVGGEVVEGYVLVDLKQPMNIRSIKFNILGRSKVHWSQTRYNGKNRRTIDYRSHEVYFNNYLFLVGSENGEAQEHPAGRHEHRFSFTLPENVPSSFEGMYGYVRYTASACLDRPWKFDHDTKQAFTVLAHWDLNCIQGIGSAQEGRTKQEVSCCCCISGDVSVVFRINKRGFVPGENMVVYAEIHNKSNTEIQQSNVQMYQESEFYGVSDAFFSSGQMKPKASQQLVLSKSRGPVAPGQSDFWECIPVKIPSLPPSELPHCDNIKINYYVIFTVPNPYGADLKLTCPVIIGTIPIREVVTTQPVAQLDVTTPSVPTAPPPYEPPPPSYEECVTGHVDIRDDGDSQYLYGQLSYAPVYPTYNLPPPPPSTAASAPGYQELTRV